MICDIATEIIHPRGQMSVEDTIQSDERPGNDSGGRRNRSRSSRHGMPRRSSSATKGRYNSAGTGASKDDATCAADIKEQKNKSRPARSSRSLSPPHLLPEENGINQMEPTRTLSSVQEVWNESMNGSILFPLSPPLKLEPNAVLSNLTPSCPWGTSTAPAVVREGGEEKNHTSGENSIHLAPVGKLNSLDRLLDLPDVGHSKRRTSRIPSGANSVQSGVSKLSYNSFSASNDSSMPSLSSFAEHDLSSVGNFSFMTTGTNISGDASVVTTGANSVMTSESDIKSMSSSVCARVQEGGSERPIILSLIPPDVRNVKQTHSYSSVMTHGSGSTTRSDVQSSARASLPPPSKGERPSRRGKGSPTPMARHVIMAVNSDVQYDLEGTTLDVLGPNIANPHKNKPQARWESVSQPKKNFHAVKPTPGNEHVAPLTHNQKNLLPAKKDAMPMYRRPRSMSNPSSPTEAVGSNSVSSAAMSGRQSHKLGDMWKTLLLEPPPVIKDHHDVMKKDFQPMAVTRHDSFSELPWEEPSNMVDARARSRSDNDIDLFESFSSIGGARENWRDDSDTIHSALVASLSSGIVLITSPTPTWEYEEPPTATTSTATSRRADTKPRSSSSRRRSISNSKRSSSRSTRSTRSNDSAKGISASGVLPSVSVPPPPPPPPPPALPM